MDTEYNLHMIKDVKSIPSQSTDLFNCQINYYLKTHKCDLSLNISCITTMFHLLTILKKKKNLNYVYMPCSHK